MDGYERRKQAKVDKIFTASFPLFSKFGFHKVSVNEIARQANVSPATIYNYFGTKEQLYLDMMADWMDKQLERYESILDSDLSFPEKTREIMLAEAANVKLLAEAMPTAPFADRGRLTQLLETYGEGKVRDFFMKYAALGKREGFIRDGLSDETTAVYFNMYKNELGRLWGATDAERPHRRIDMLMELFFYGLIGETPSAKSEKERTGRGAESGERA
ncbi:TetR/AcrR family transcriptional regulator [Paenibacillus flagellatus]|uniref:TetR/AcrR family transcriptional regulator n=1 Tax=Paenibacillus flagellatus TaxID=2211139 RepID=A0A2V5KCX2_9BACL|nr:TetR/AcrR family transcriptional regulator [Paenibacillus flagellatus]PYI57481.1 TetR/AcrR family transcriptional regulator [Paenibacillus flagellatus]